MNEPIILRYVAENGEWVFGLPRCDMTQSMIDESGFSAEQLCAYRPVVYELVGAVDAPKENDEVK